MTSFSAKMVNIILKFRGIKKIFSSEEGALQGVAEDRKRGPAKPSGWLLKNCDIHEERVDGHLVYKVTPKNNGSAHHVVYFHGGGYALDMAAEHWKYLTKLVQATGASLTVPIYPMAPENDWRPAYAMARKLYDALIETNDAANITFMGDSAGGGFSLGLAQMLRNDGQVLPGKLALLSPWIDGKCDDPAHLEIAPKDNIIAVPAIQAMGRWWAGKDGDAGDFPVSPLFYDIENLPPIGVWTGTHDLLYVDAKKLKAKADAANIAIDYHVYPQMQHVWMILPMKEADVAVAEIAAFMTR